MKTNLFKFILIGLFAVVSFHAQAFQQGPPPAKVVTVPIEMRLLSPQVRVPGTVVSRNDARISAEITGRIIWISEVGDSFKKGQVIARIDNTFYKNEVRRLEADLLQKTQSLARIEELAASQFSSASTLQQAIADKEMSTAILDQAKYNLERTQIKAPFTGVVVERIGQVGEFASAGVQVLRFVDTENMEVSARVPISSAPFLEGVENVFVTANLTGQLLALRAVVPVGDERSRMMEIRVSLPPGTWVVGTAVKVDVPSGPAREVLAVPRDALILRTNSIFLFTIDGEDNAQRISVRLGAASGDYVEVIGNVTEGSQVVVRGGERLREGQKVAIADNT